MYTISMRLVHIPTADDLEEENNLPSQFSDPDIDNGGRKELVNTRLSTIDITINVGEGKQLLIPDGGLPSLE